MILAALILEPLLLWHDQKWPKLTFILRKLNSIFRIFWLDSDGLNLNFWMIIMYLGKKMARNGQKWQLGLEVGSGYHRWWSLHLLSLSLFVSDTIKNDPNWLSYEEKLNSIFMSLLIFLAMINQSIIYHEID